VGDGLVLSADGTYHMPAAGCMEHGVWGFIIDPADQLDLYTSVGMTPLHAAAYATSHLTIQMDVQTLEFARFE
jgi:hypothetical protein